MTVIDRIAARHAEMTAWRHDFHAHPEIAFEEKRTSDIVASKLESFGVEVHRGLAKTGVVGTIRNGDGPAIGLRADMDALPISEANQFAHRSTIAGKMHACGHDGHTTMLRGAARYLAETKRFRGTVHFIFQPAEENEGGGRVMVEEGLFEKFPVKSVFGMHNYPGQAVGTIACRAGPMMAGTVRLQIEIIGRGTHAANPQMGIDPVVVGSHIVTALQTIVSRSISPLDSVVISITNFHVGEIWNVIAEKAVLRGTIRYFRPEVEKEVGTMVHRIAENVAAAYGAKVKIHYELRYPPTVNHPAETEEAARVAAMVVGAENVIHDPTPTMGAEDFAFMLQKRPGTYVWLGGGSDEGGCFCHSPTYDFNDEILPIGTTFWIKLVETLLV